LSSRAFRRERERRAAAERRRERLRLRRGGLIAGAAVGAFALAPAAAQAANFEVNTLADSAPDPSPGACTTAVNGCTLREAINDANANTEADQITFKSGLTGTITLLNGPLIVGGSTGHADPVTVQGPGPGVITVSGDANGNSTPDTGDSGIFAINYVSSGLYPTLNVSGLTLSGGYATSGGAVYLQENGKLSLSNTRVTGNKASSGGAIGGEFPKYTSVSIDNSTISGNNASSGGATFTDGPLTITNSTLSDNHATGSGGGAISAGQKYGSLSITDSTISGNTATGSGGGVSAYAINFGKYAGATTQNQITRTSISGNTADATGGGLYMDGLLHTDSSFTVDHSTISDNDAGATAQGGGIEIGDTIEGTFRTVDSTVSGNSANIGAGVAISTDGNEAQVADGGAISFDNSTFAANTAAESGGGMYLGIYGPSGGGPYTYSATIGLSSTIVGGNTANGASNDLDHADAATTGGFALAFSLVQAPGDGVLNQSSSILNQDPQLGALGNNGGPTLTQLPSASSPALDAGSNPLALATDQRGLPRTVDQSAPNAGDGTDIGAVEREAPAPAPASPAKPKCKKKHKKKHKRSAESSKKHKKHKKCKKKKKKKHKH
jgi:CSLREA domain-containing protein